MNHRFLTLFLLSAAALSPVDLPELPSSNARWLNGVVPKLAAKKPTILFVFARDCGNCRRTHAFVNQLHSRLGPRVNIVGVHTPEFDDEKDVSKLLKYARSVKISYPVIIDNDWQVWRALSNRYWPAMYLFDRDSKHFATYIGETHVDDDQARRIESEMYQLAR